MNQTESCHAALQKYSASVVLFVSMDTISTSITLVHEFTKFTLFVVTEGTFSIASTCRVILHYPWLKIGLELSTVFQIGAGPTNLVVCKSDEHVHLLLLAN